MNPKYNKPNKKKSHLDVYDIIDMWQVTNPALQHLLKKVLDTGNRGHKSIIEDCRDLIDSAERALELELEKHEIPEE